MIEEPRVLRILGLLLALALAFPLAPSHAEMTDLAPPVVDRFVRLALDCVEREYPSKISHVMESGEDALTPRALHPVFYGCFDWHSAVHGHWLLVRMLRLMPDAPFAREARAALKQNFTHDNIVGELVYFERESRSAFERPYGLAWLLQIMTELREWDDKEARQWSHILQPLEEVVARRITDWVPKLTNPIRSGTHAQTAFALGVVLDWAQVFGDPEIEETLTTRIIDFYGADTDCPIRYEPSGEDFLSPCLMEADLMRRIYGPARFATWLGAFLPGIPTDGTDRWLTLGVVTDPKDGKLAHLDGLNLSRSWALQGIASGLPASDPRRRSLLAAAKTHADAGLAAVSETNYEGSHWLGSFAAYLVTERGLPARTEQDGATHDSNRQEQPQ